jgi:hypothetical protein
MSGALCDLGGTREGTDKGAKTGHAKLIEQRNLNISRYAIVSKQHRLKPPPLHSTNLKKEKGFFFSFRFKTTSLRPRYIGHMSGALCDLGGTREGTDKGAKTGSCQTDRAAQSKRLKKTAQT